MSLSDLGLQLVPNLFGPTPSNSRVSKPRTRATGNRHILVTANSANVDETGELPMPYRKEFRPPSVPPPGEHPLFGPSGPLSSAKQKAMLQAARRRYGPK